MLVRAYTQAEAGNYEEVHTLQALFERPYDEQPEHEAEYYRATPRELRGRGGIEHMS